MADGSGDYSLYRQAIQTYRKVVTEYAQSSLVAYSLLSIAQINEENLQDLDGAAAAYKEILRYFPNSVMGREAGAVLDRFDDELANRDKTPDVQLTSSTSNGELTDLPRLNNVRNFNGPEYARVVLDLSQGTRYADHRIENSRVGIFISGGAVDSSLQGRRFITRGSGLLKRITVSDAGPGSDRKGKAHSNAGPHGVSIEIETTGLYGYSTFRLSDPERIIIDLHSPKYAAEARATWRPAAAGVPPPRHRISPHPGRRRLDMALALPGLTGTARGWRAAPGLLPFQFPTRRRLPHPAPMAARRRRLIRQARLKCRVL